MSYMDVVLKITQVVVLYTLHAAPIRYNLRIVTDIAIVGPRTLATAGA